MINSHNMMDPKGWCVLDDEQDFNPVIGWAPTDHGNMFVWVKFQAYVRLVQINSKVQEDVEFDLVYAPGIWELRMKELGA